MFKVTLATGEQAEVRAVNRRSAIQQFKWWVQQLRQGRHYNPYERGIDPVVGTLHY